MVMGGIPHYLQHVKRGQSVTQIVDRMCFTKDGLLATEFSNLYRSLFAVPELHEGVVRTLASRRQGMTRTEVARLAGIDSGGTLTKVLNELKESGFIRETPALYTRRKLNLWRLTDEYSLFYLTWIENNRRFGAGLWNSMSARPSWKAWCGYAFENLCLSHIEQIKSTLGIAGVLTQTASWLFQARSKDDEGAQIDLLIDRADQCINLCEMKFSQEEFIIDKRLAGELERKLRVFRRKSKTRKAIFLTMITSEGCRENSHFLRLNCNSIELKQLFG
jgi:hypothetical protein